MGWGDRWTCHGVRVGVSEGRWCMIGMVMGFMSMCDSVDTYTVPEDCGA